MVSPMVSADLLAAARAIEPQIVEDRRRIHFHPELAYEEEQTSSLVRIRLEELGIPFRSGLA
jgi:metal-dependent amidase/aminoacylase/carboxypeptidase family protein